MCKEYGNYQTFRRKLTKQNHVVFLYNFSAILSMFCQCEISNTKTKMLAEVQKKGKALEKRDFLPESGRSLLVPPM